MLRLNAGLGQRFLVTAKGFVWSEEHQAVLVDENGRPLRIRMPT